MIERPPCCSVGARPDVADIDAMLREGMTHRAVAAAIEGLNATAVYRHKAHVSIDGTEHGTPLKQPETPVSPKVTIPLPALPVKGARMLQLIPPSPGDDPVTSPRKLITAEIENRAVAMRVAGKEYEDVADALGLSLDNAIDVVERCLMRTNTKTNKNVEVLRAIELRRCDAIIAANWDRGQDPAMAECEVPADSETGFRKYDGQDKANAIILKAMDRKAKLAGLDAPASPLVQLNFFGSAEFKTFTATMFAALSPHPAAFRDVETAFRLYMAGNQSGGNPLRIVDMQPEPLDVTPREPVR